MGLIFPVQSIFPLFPFTCTSTNQHPPNPHPLLLPTPSGVTPPFRLQLLEAGNSCPQVSPGSGVPVPAELLLSLLPGSEGLAHREFPRQRERARPGHPFLVSSQSWGHRGEAQGGFGATQRWHSPGWDGTDGTGAPLGFSCLGTLAALMLGGVRETEENERRRRLRGRWCCCHPRQRAGVPPAPQLGVLQY